MRKILLGTTAVVGLALVAQAANAQQARPAARPAPVAAPAAPPALPATSVAPTGTAAALFQTPVGVTGAGPHGPDGVPNRPTTPTTSGLIVRLGGFFDFSMGNVQDDADKAFFRNVPAGSATNTANVNFAGNVGNLSVPGSAAVTNAKGRQRTDFRTEAEINLYVDGIAANGMRYGAMFELQMDTMVTTAGTGTGVDYDELYGFVKGSWGELRFGQEDSAASLMQIRRPGTLWMGTDDAWDEFTVNSVNGTPYIMSGINDGNDSTKIIYLSPQFMGFDAGVSYSPNRNEGENFVTATSTTAYQRDFTGLTNEISAALRYRGTFGDVGVGASFVAQFADAGRQSATGAPVGTMNQNVTAYSGGLLLRAYGFAVGGEYTWGNYIGSAPAGAALPKGWDGSKHYVVGGTYTIGALTLGAQYGSGTQDNGSAADAPADRTQTYLGLGVAYVLAPGMTLFANYNQIEDENVPNLGPSGAISAGSGKNTLARFGTNDTTRDITVLVAGVRVAF
ncbi:MAG: porin [Alphaproteobacteria bacterium]|nr:porin [Alphaproteobacteria bacterium]